MDTVPTGGPSDRLGFDAAQSNVSVCRETARWLCRKLLESAGGPPPVRELVRLWERYRETLPQACPDDLAPVTRFFDVLAGRIARRRADRRGDGFDPLDLPSNPDTFWKRAHLPATRAQLRDCSQALARDAGEVDAPTGADTDLPAGSDRAAILGLPELPPLDANLLVVHYSTERLAFCGARTPRVAAVVVRHAVSGHSVAFAVHREAERAGIAAADIPLHSEGLEARMLQRFYWRACSKR